MNALRSVCVCLCAYLYVCESLCQCSHLSRSVILLCFLLQEDCRCFIGLQNFCVPVPVSASGCSILKPRPTCALKLRSHPKPGAAILGTHLSGWGDTLPLEALEFRFTTQAQQSENTTAQHWENTQSFCICCSSAWKTLLPSLLIAGPILLFRLRLQYCSP